MKKKVLARVLSIALAVGMAFPVNTTMITWAEETGEINEVEPECKESPDYKHHWGEADGLDPAPTCVEEGLEWVHCTYCGEGQSQTVSALGHDWIETEATAATCTTPGRTADRYCSRCGDTVAGEEIPALGHNWIETEETTATCTTAGHTAGKYCSRCNETVEGKDIPALGHNWVTDAPVKATCTSTGKEAGRHCTRCDVNEGGKVIAALGHSWVTDPAVAPTCTTEGKSEGNHCTRCGTVGVRQNTTPATGHKLLIVRAVGATCKKAGNTAGFRCSTCGWSNIKVVKVAHQWKDNGKKGHKCKVCGTKEAHTYGFKSGAKYNKNGTITADHKDRCTSCGRTEKHSRHNWVSAAWNKYNSCLRCSLCGLTTDNHKWKRIDNATYQCTTCKKTHKNCKDSKVASDHIWQYHNNFYLLFSKKWYECNICGKKSAEDPTK